MTTPIQASALRVGMFVHLNVGWMSHPFPLSSFKITSAEQLETIRSLGLAKMTWSPERSDPDASAAGPTGPHPGEASDPPPQAAAESAAAVVPQPLSPAD